MMSVRTLLAAALVAVIAVTTLAPIASAQGRKGPGLRLIRDAEIENTVRQYADPVLNAVGLSGLDGRIWEGPRKDTLKIKEGGKRKVLRGDHIIWVDVQEQDDVLV